MLCGLTPVASLSLRGDVRLGSVHVARRIALYAVAYALQDDAGPAVQRLQVRLPEHRTDGILAQGFAHQLGQRLGTIVEAIR